MWKRPKSESRSLQCRTMRHGCVVIAFAVFLTCVLLSFPYILQPESTHRSLGSRNSKISRGPYIPHLDALNSQAAADDETPDLKIFEDEDSTSDSALVDSRGGAPGCLCDRRHAELKVYMYNLPAEFHYGMISEFDPAEGGNWPANASRIPQYPGGLYKQHSPEYWLTSDLLTSNMADRNTACTAFRVDDWEEADVMFVPFFASLSYNRYGKLTDQKSVTVVKEVRDKNEELQVKLVTYLENQPAWKASAGKDHVIVMHHPNSMHVVRDRLRNALFVVSDFGRYGSEVANLRKDVVAPYKHVIPAFNDDSSHFDSRSTLLFFQGAIVRKEGGKIRQDLHELLKDEPGVHFTTGNTASNGFHSATAGMRSSKFCLNLAGDTPSSNRLFDSIVSHCVPVIISDEIELPFEDDLDYSQFAIFIDSTKALEPGYVINMLRNVSSEEWSLMWERLIQVERHFEYQHPTLPDDAVNMVWKAIARRLPAINFAINRHRRYAANPSWRHRKSQTW